MKKNKIPRIVLGLAVSAFLLLCSCGYYGESKEFDGFTLYYTDAVTEEDADYLGDFLEYSEFADPSNEIALQLNKTGNTYEVRMPVKKGIEQDQEIKDEIKLVAAEISAMVFDGAQVDFHLCDDKLNTLVVVPMARW
jgi:hypothetical protein